MDVGSRIENETAPKRKFFVFSECRENRESETLMLNLGIFFLLFGLPFFAVFDCLVDFGLLFRLLKLLVNPLAYRRVLRSFVWGH